MEGWIDRAQQCVTSGVAAMSSRPVIALVLAHPTEYQQRTKSAVSPIGPLEEKLGIIRTIEACVRPRETLVMVGGTRRGLTTIVLDLLPQA